MVGLKWVEMEICKVFRGLTGRRRVTERCDDLIAAIVRRERRESSIPDGGRFECFYTSPAEGSAPSTAHQRVWAFREVDLRFPTEKFCDGSNPITSAMKSSQPRKPGSSLTVLLARSDSLVRMATGPKRKARERGAKLSQRPAPPGKNPRPRKRSPSSSRALIGSWLAKISTRSTPAAGYLPVNTWSRFICFTRSRSGNVVACRLSDAARGTCSIPS